MEHCNPELSVKDRSSMKFAREKTSIFAVSEAVVRAVFFIDYWSREP